MHTRKWLGLGVLMMVTTGGAVVHGRLSNRWGPQQHMTEAGTRLERIPSQIGTWQMVSSQHLDDSARAMLGCTGDIVRSYVNPTGKSEASLTLIVGPPGPIAVHSPEICFPSRNYRLLDERKRVEIRDSLGIEHEFWMVVFQSQDLEARLLHVYYGWSTGGTWTAPDNPRFEFAGSPFLYKVQLVAYDSSQRGAADPALALLREFLVAAKDVLISVVSN